MGKSVNELYEMFDRLYDLKARAAVEKGVAARKKLKRQIVNGVNDFLPAVSDSSPGPSSENGGRVSGENLAELKKSKERPKSYAGGRCAISEGASLCVTDDHPRRSIIAAPFSVVMTYLRETTGFFDEATVIGEPQRINPADGGQTTILYDGPPLTVGGELNKLASNIATGRNIAGVHWRTDGVEAIKLGEAVAISMLRDMRETYSEPFGGFTLTTSDGTTVTV